MSDARHHILRRARRRALLRRSIDRAGTGLAAGLVLALAALLAARLGGLPLRLPALFAIAAAGLAAGAATAMLRRPDSIDVARALDRHFGLRDRLATAAWIEGARVAGEGGVLPPGAAQVAREPGFAEFVGSDAERHVRGLDVAAALPLRVSRAWPVAAVLAIALVAAAMLGPSASAARGVRAPRAGDAAARQAERDAVAAEITAAAGALRGEDGAAGSPEAQEALRTLDDLAAQLGGDGRGDGAQDDPAGPSAPDDPGGAAARSAAALDDLAGRLGAQAERDGRAADELTRRFSGMEAARRLDDDPAGRSIAPPMSAEELRERLRRGEFGAAAESLADMLEESGGQGAPARREIADALRDVARDAEIAAARRPEDDRGGAESEDQAEGAVSETAESEGAAPAAESGEEPGGGGDRLDRLRRILRDQGVDEEALRDLMDREELRPEDLERALDAAGLDEERQRELARELDEARDERALDDQVRRDAEEIADALRRAADEIETGERPSAPPPDADAPPPDAAPPSTPRSPEPPRSGQAPNEQPREEPKSGAPAREDQPRGEPTSGEPAREGQPRGEPKSGEAAGEGQPGGEPKSGEPARDQQPGGAPTPAGAAREQEARGDRKPGESPREQRTGGDEPRGGAAPHERSRPDDVLREIAERGQRADDSRRFAERAREAASRLAGDMTEEERRRWAGAMPGAVDRPDAGARTGDGAAAPGTAPPPLPGAQGSPLDLGGADTPGVPVAEWLDDEAGSPGGSTAAATRVEGAQKAARRAVEDEIVPRRYHRLIRRYFERLPETAEAARDQQRGPGS